MQRAKLLQKGIDVMSPNPTLTPVDPKPASDLTAIAFLKQGKIEGLAVLVHMYQAEAVHAALLILRDLDQAEDVVQEAFLHAYRKINQFDDHRPFAPWFMRIVINAAIKAANRQNRTMPLEEQDQENEMAEWLIDPDPNPETLAERADLREEIWRAMGQLTPEQRAAVVLRYFLDRNESEMIQELNRPRTTIKWWLYAARQRLRTLLYPAVMNEPDNPRGTTKRGRK